MLFSSRYIVPEPNFGSRAVIWFSPCELKFGSWPRTIFITRGPHEPKKNTRAKNWFRKVWVFLEVELGQGMTRGRSRDTGLAMKIDIGDRALVVAVLISNLALVIAVLNGTAPEHEVLKGGALVIASIIT